MTTRSKLITILASALAVFALVIFTGCGGDQASSKTSAQASAQSSFVPAQFTAMGIEGKKYNSSEWIGKKPVVLNFWGTWCPPCRKEIPELVRLHHEYQDKGLEMISLAVRDTPDRVLDFSNEKQMSWTMLMAENDILAKYNVTVGVPTTIFLDKHGKEVARFVGPRSYETFKQAADAVLNAA